MLQPVLQPSSFSVGKTDLKSVGTGQQNPRFHTLVAFVMAAALATAAAVIRTAGHCVGLGNVRPLRSCMVSCTRGICIDQTVVNIGVHLQA